MILSKTAKPVDLDRKIDEYVSSGKINQILVIVPTNRKLRNLKKEFISLSPNKTVSKINLETLSTMSSRLLSKQQNFHELSEAASTVLIKQSALEIQTKYFTSYRDEIPFGTLDRIKNVISEYKRHGITPAILRNEAEKLDSAERLKANDIAEIYESYNKKCSELSALEIGDVYKFLDERDAKELESIFRELFPEVEFTILLGFDEFTNLEVDLIDKLSRIEGMELFIDFDYYRYNKFIFSHLEKTYERLEEKGFQRIDDLSLNRRSEFQNLVREKLFKQNVEKNSSFKNNLFKLSASDREEEIKLIAKEIKKIIAQGNNQLHKICVAFNLIDKYSPIVRDTFRSYGIPFNLTDRISLNNSFPVIELINFLEISENDFYHKNIFRALSGGFIKISGVDLFNLKRSAANLKIVAGRNNWINSIKNAEANLKFDEDLSENQLIRKRSQFAKAENDIRKIYSLLKPFERKLPMKSFVTEIKELSLKLGLHKNLLLDAGGKEEENIKAVSSFFETIEEIFDLLELEDGDEKEYPLDFFLDQIRTASNWARFNVKEKSNYGVQVTTINEIRGLKFDHLFIAGMNDGDFPTRYVPEIFFSGSFVRNENRHITEQRYHFYQSLCSFDKRLYLSFPKTDNEKEIVQSTFLKDFENLFEMKELIPGDYNKLIFSKEELLQYIGKSRNYSELNEKVEIPSSEKIERTIDIDNIRANEPFRESVHNGFLLGEDAQSIPESAKDFLESLKRNQYSISQLENYAKCPFKFFMERILKIELLEEPTEEVEALELGSVLHSILFNFYTELRNRKIDLSDKSIFDLNEVESLLFEIAEEISEKVFFNSDVTFFEREKLFGLGGNRKESILYKFLETEIEGNQEFKPSFFEVSFGNVHKTEKDELLSTDQPVAINGVKLRGKIDRIEVDENSNKFNIVDYKLSNTKPPAKDFAEGISLQLPVYMKAAQLLLNEKYGESYEPAKMFIYSLKYDESKFGKLQIRIGDQASMINEILDRIKEYVDDIPEGKFNLSRLEKREEKVCRYCDFRSVCRVQETIN